MPRGNLHTSVSLVLPRFVLLNQNKKKKNKKKQTFYWCVACSSQMILTRIIQNFEINFGVKLTQKWKSPNYVLFQVE